MKKQFQILALVMAGIVLSDFSKANQTDCLIEVAKDFEHLTAVRGKIKQTECILSDKECRLIHVTPVFRGTLAPDKRADCPEFGPADSFSFQRCDNWPISDDVEFVFRPTITFRMPKPNNDLLEPECAFRGAWKSGSWAIKGEDKQRFGKGSTRGTTGSGLHSSETIVIDASNECAPCCSAIIEKDESIEGLVTRVSIEGTLSGRTRLDLDTDEFRCRSVFSLSGYMVIPLDSSGMPLNPSLETPWRMKGILHGENLCPSCLPDSTCGGIAGIPCDDSEVCELPAGECESADLFGQCVPRPEVCPEIFAPVCGCDGVTYDNDCVRLSAGVQKASNGPCEPTQCGGIAGIPCDDSEVCELPAGECESADLFGQCVPRPEVCPEIFAPVCGCDGVTYNNDCVRLSAGVQKASNGPCEPTQCGGIAGIPCDDSEVCELPAGECESADLFGQCVPRPEVCPEIFAPVCGCDGVTYDNDCVRLSAGVQKASNGPCEPTQCGGIAGIPCDDSEVCELPAGECESADLFGQCVPRPEVCPEIFAPVCGCDGVTYNNDCIRLSAGVTKAHDGECQE